jgi:hypothetical protein
MSVKQSAENAIFSYPKEPTNQPSMQGVADLFGRIRFTFDSVADLLADTDLTYTVSGTKVVAAGDIIGAGGYVYEVVASGSSTNHIATAGSVKMNVLPVIGADYAAAAFGITTGSDQATAIQNAYDSIMAAGGGRLFFGVGTFVIGTSLTLVSGSASTFNQGPQIIGAGIGLTVFDNQVSSAPMFDVSSGGTPGSNFLMGGLLTGFKVISTTGSAQIGIQLDTSYMVQLAQIHIDGMAGTGLRIPCAVGDNDGSNMVNMDHVRIENCTGWGIDAKGDAGFNETSFITMNHVFVQACGTNSAASTPPSGGMQWKGQILSMNQCAFTLNQNCAFWVPGEAGLGQSCFLYDTTFENNHKRAIYCTGIKAFKGRNLQFYSNDTYVMTNAVEFDGSTYTVANVDIKGVVVRATSGNNAYTAFKISGTNTEFANCRVEDVNYDNFGYAGQTKQDGFTNEPTAIVEKTGAQSVFSTMSAVLFDSEVSDQQAVYNTGNGRWSVNYPTYAQFKGQLTITGLTAGDKVEIELYDVVNTVAIGNTILPAGGLTDESFAFDFTVAVGTVGTSREYQIRASQNNGGGSKALNVTSAHNNTLHVRRVSDGAI